MPRKPTGKRARREDGTYVVVNKAGNWAGSVFHVPERRTALSDGRVRIRRPHWRATYRDPVSGRERAVSAPTRDEVMHRRDEALADAVDRAPRSRRFGETTTVAEFATWSLGTHAARLRAGSVIKYQERLNRLGPLAELAINDVTAEQVADWQTWLLTTPRPDGRILSATTMADTRTTVRQLFTAAVDLGLVRANPVDRVRPPRVARSAGRVLTAEEVARLIAETDRHRYGAVVAILFTVGLRVSEVLGLAWSDIDLEAGTARVRRAVVDSAEGRTFGPTKTASGGWAAVANPHLRIGGRRSSVHPTRWPPRRSATDRQAAAARGGTNRDRCDAPWHACGPPHRRDDALHRRHRHRRHRPARWPCQPDDHIWVRGQPRRSPGEDRRARRQAARHTDVALDEAMMSPAREPV
jgi:integrase